MRDLLWIAAYLPGIVCATTNSTVLSITYRSSLPDTYRPVPTSSGTASLYHANYTTTTDPITVGPTNSTPSQSPNGTDFVCIPRTDNPHYCEVQSVIQYPDIKITESTLLSDVSTIQPMDAGGVTHSAQAYSIGTTGDYDWPKFHPDTKSTATALLPESTPMPLEMSQGGTTTRNEQGGHYGSGGNADIVAPSEVSGMLTDANPTTAVDYAYVTSNTARQGHYLATPVLTIGGSTVTAGASGAFVVGSQTLAPGASAITVGETTYSLNTEGSSVVVNGVAYAVQAEGDASVGGTDAYYTVGGSTITRGPSGVVIAGQTLSPGSQTVISDTTYSLQPSEPAALAINGNTVSDVPFDVKIAGQTLAPGSETIIAGTTYSLGSSQPVLLVDGTTMPSAIPSIVIAGQTIAPSGQAIISGVTYSLGASQPILVVNDATITRGPSGVVVADQTLALGSQTVVAGITFSLGSDQPALVVDGVTASPQYSTPEPVFTFESSTYTENAEISGFLIGSQTLTAGGFVTLGSDSAVETLGMSVGDWGATAVLIGTTSTIVLGDLSRATLGTLASTTSVAAEASGGATDGGTSMKSGTQEMLIPKTAARLLALFSVLVLWL